MVQKNITKCSAEHLSVSVLANNWIGTAGYVYDAAGNMTNDATEGVSTTFDAENRVSVAIKGGASTNYVYDADGNRVAKSSGSTGTIYWYGAPGIIAESDLTGALKSEYVFFNGRRVARIDSPGNAVHYYVSDALNSTSMVVSAAGVVENESEYYPWGRRASVPEQRSRQPLQIHRQRTRFRIRPRLLRRTLLLQRLGPVHHTRLGSEGDGCAVCGVR